MRVDKDKRQRRNAFGDLARIWNVHARIDQRGSVGAAKQIEADNSILDAPRVVINFYYVCHNDAFSDSLCFISKWSQVYVQVVSENIGKQTKSPSKLLLTIA